MRINIREGWKWVSKGMRHKGRNAGKEDEKKNDEGRKEGRELI